jgi:hypothetical protein
MREREREREMKEKKIYIGLIIMKLQVLKRKGTPKKFLEKKKSRTKDTELERSWKPENRAELPPKF